MLQYDGISELVKAAPKRLADARELLEQPTWEPNRSDAGYRHLCAARYLAGYAVECALKAVIIERTEWRRKQWTKTWTEVLDSRQTQGLEPDLSGSRSHSLQLLLNVSGLSEDLDRNEEMKRSWGTCCKWSPALRYQPDHVTDRGSATEMVEACERVYQWLKSQLQLAM